MKLRNKKTGAIYNIEDLDLDNKQDGIWIGLTKYNSFAELNSEWEDYEDELLYIISSEHKSGYQCVLKEDYPDICEVAKELGIGFETEKECREAVAKLKAWKRLKDANIDYKLTHEYDDFTETMHANVSFSFNSYPLVGKDLNLLFGGGE